MLVLLLIAVALPLGLWLASSRYARRHVASGDWDAQGPRRPSGPRWRGPAAIGALLGGKAFTVMHGEPGEVPHADDVESDGPATEEADEVAWADDTDDVDAEDDEDADTGSSSL